MRRLSTVLPTPEPGWAYFLDLDGTLVELAESPAVVEVDAGLPRLVEVLRRSSGGALAIISGRALDDLDRLFPNRQYAAAGQHGFERRDVRGRCLAVPPTGRGFEAARRRLTRLASLHRGLEFEDKGSSFALHYRRAPGLAAFAHQSARAVQHRLGARYAVQPGKRVIEIKPAGRNKGSAIAAFMREAPFAGRTPLFIGDDRTDEHGFAVVNRLNGHSVKVGPGSTAAHWRLPNVEAVIGWLKTGRPQPRPVRRRARR
jgi:trehalose 6-phosphate phosphatase